VGDEKGNGYSLPIKGLKPSGVPEEKVVHVNGEELKIDQHGFLI
jgi:hypothetical protein